MGLGAGVVDVTSPEFESDPYRHFAALRDEHPLYYHEGIDAYFLSRHEDVVRALRDPLFSTAAYESRLGPIMGAPVLDQYEGADLTLRRKLAIRPFSGNALDEHRKTVRRRVEGLIDEWRARGHVDLVRDFAGQFAIQSILDILGLPEKDAEQLTGWYQGILAYAVAVELDDETATEGVSCGKQLAEYLDPIIDSRRRSSGSDVISVLASGDFAELDLTTPEIRALCLNILIAAAEPAEKGVVLLIHNLIDHPEQADQIRRDRSLIPLAIAETLRFTPPVHLVPRRTTTDIPVSGGILPGESTVFSMIAAANRDPKVFRQPDEFRIDRTELGSDRAFTAAARHVTFGAGRHFCIGAGYARMTIETAANALLDAMSNIRYLPGFEYAEHGLYARGPASLRLLFEPR
ncbi:pulcherriminic acid synthase [Streptomyces sp. LBL]|uniref:cytochrome P450 n=1 Tax=Streptomyces sp. LBL TaxID=2940562 RepID=UPI002475338A|nr:cytochrome P450 [Streptomyces sp. LBL]MDH6624278.1 pulcherriminic acid synthase [Streptomyces sp. LBL]